MRALDLFCGAGGAGAGLARAGFVVTGVDIEPQPNYPFDFVKMDAIEAMKGDLRQFEFIWASPPCQAYTPLNAYNKKEYPDLVDVTRQALRASGVPYVIENVMQAPLIDPVMLCGSMFGLRVYRHRGFEASFPIAPPAHPEHHAVCSRNGNIPRDGQFMTITGGKHSRAWQRRAALEMGVFWMQTVREVCEAIPPAYSEFIAKAFLNQQRKAA